MRGTSSQLEKPLHQVHPGCAGGGEMQFGRRLCVANDRERSRLNDGGVGRDSNTVVETKQRCVSRYSPTTSRNFSSKRGSVLKVRIRCGLSPCARHTRLTKLWVVPTCRAIDRHDQCVAPPGVVCVVASITVLRNRACSSVLSHPGSPLAVPSLPRCPPAPHLVLIYPQFRRYRLVRLALCRQHHPRPLPQPYRRAPGRRPSRQSPPLSLRQFHCCRYPHRLPPSLCLHFAAA